MSKKTKSDKNGFVFSTDPNFNFQEAEQPALETLAPAQQKLKIILETKHRRGKAVTLVGLKELKVKIRAIERKVNICFI